jgi:hypothetical protein
MESVDWRRDVCYIYSMQTIVRGKRPPNFERIAAVFPGARGKGTIFSYGDRIYLPDGGNLSRELMAHEGMHGMRQIDMGVEVWWDEYLRNPAFMFEEELLAHRAEYAAYRAGRHGRSRAGHLHIIAERLSGTLYGNVVTYAGAVDLITKGGFGVIEIKAREVEEA